MKIQETLKNYGGFILNAITDENIEDIKLAIKYDDHGDEFLYVKTYSGDSFTYGYWLNRNDCFEDFDISKNNGESDALFIRRPILFSIPDKDAVISNKIYDIFHSDIGIMCKRSLFYEINVTHNYSLDYSNFCRTVIQLESVIDEAQQSGIYYSTEGYCKDLCIDFIKEAGLGEECLARIEKIKWSSKINGFDGLAGKRESDNYITFDDIQSIIYRGKSFDINKVRTRDNANDEWGFWTRSLNVKQFA